MAEKKKKIAVVGAGPVGLQAAWILAKRGHEVKVYEKEITAGGQYRLAAVFLLWLFVGLLCDRSDVYKVREW